ncbi:MAG: hypothetical protein WDW36_000069 [Sanguina aurantia]
MAAAGEDAPSPPLKSPLLAAAAAAAAASTTTAALAAAAAALAAAAAAASPCDVWSRLRLVIAEHPNLASVGCTLSSQRPCTANDGNSQAEGDCTPLCQRHETASAGTRASILQAPALGGLHTFEQAVVGSSKWSQLPAPTSCPPEGEIALLSWQAARKRCCHDHQGR